MEKNNTTATKTKTNSTMENTRNSHASMRGAANGVASTHSGHTIEGKTQWRQYHHKTGHGFAAEDANAQFDRWHGKRVECVGRDNSANGADRIVNGQKIQTKYCRCARETVNSAFDSTTGKYRYDGMQLEVPKDQYDECVRRMRDAISQGKVEGVTDPEMASQIVRKGHVSYQQAQKITKAGNWESIKFDIRTQTVSCLGAGAIGAAIGFVNAKRNGKTTQEAIKEAAKIGGTSTATALGGGVLAQQALRTTMGRNMAARATKAIKPAVEAAMKTEAGAQMLTKTASVLAGKELTKQGAKQFLTQAGRTNAVVGGAMFIATAIPDTVKVCRGKISGADYAENMVSNAAGIGGGWAGASAGAAIGTMIFPGAGTVIGGLIGGITGGMGASKASRKVTGLFRKKDKNKCA